MATKIISLLELKAFNFSIKLVLYIITPKTKNAKKEK